MIAQGWYRSPPEPDRERRLGDFPMRLTAHHRNVAREPSQKDLPAILQEARLPNEVGGLIKPNFPQVCRILPSPLDVAEEPEQLLVLPRDTHSYRSSMPLP